MTDLPLPRHIQQNRRQLSDHHRQCSQAAGAMHRLRCSGEAVHGFLARRFVTTLVVAAVLLALSQW